MDDTMRLFLKSCQIIVDGWRMVVVLELVVADDDDDDAVVRKCCKKANNCWCSSYKNNASAGMNA